MNNNKVINNINNGLMKFTDSMVESKSPKCYFLWGEPEVPEKLKKFYNKKNDNQK